ncbi:MAG TPA: DUF4383 domain-containing protein [Candidatus Saccharimonas sp.]|nr:DUF4383 domain-containing protein [Candidatus Saccharimonas sp.]
MIKKISLVFGVVFLLIGILGFVPGLTTTGDEGMPMLLGLFMVGAFHNVIHIASGVIGLLSASSERYTRWYLQIFGIVYALVAIIGIVQGDSVLGLFSVNVADNVLHVVLAVLLLGAGFGIKPSATPATPVKPAM